MHSHTDKYTPNSTTRGCVFGPLLFSFWRKEASSGSLFACEQANQHADTRGLLHSFTHLLRHTHARKHFKSTPQTYQMSRQRCERIRCLCLCGGYTGIKMTNGKLICNTRLKRQLLKKASCVFHCYWGFIFLLKRWWYLTPAVYSHMLACAHAHLCPADDFMLVVRLFSSPQNTRQPVPPSAANPTALRLTTGLCVTATAAMRSLQMARRAKVGYSCVRIPIKMTFFTRMVVRRAEGIINVIEPPPCHVGGRWMNDPGFDGRPVPLATKQGNTSKPNWCPYPAPCALLTNWRPSLQISTSAMCTAPAVRRAPIQRAPTSAVVWRATCCSRTTAPAKQRMVRSHTRRNNLYKILQLILYIKNRTFQHQQFQTQ